MGSYESLNVGTSVELDVTGVKTEDLAAMYEVADQILSDALAAEIREAQELLPAGSTSYILSWRNNGTVNA